MYRYITRWHVGALAFLLISAPVTTLEADCVRYKPAPIPPNAVPGFDGPGSFGELHNTVTLDCLKYVGSIQKEEAEHVLIKDEQGKVHTLQLGSYMGENSGVIVKIDREAISLEQTVFRGDEWQVINVKFARH